MQFYVLTDNIVFRYDMKLSTSIGRNIICSNHGLVIFNFKSMDRATILDIRNGTKKTETEAAFPEFFYANKSLLGRNYIVYYTEKDAPIYLLNLDTMKSDILYNDDDSFISIGPDLTGFLLRFNLPKVSIHKIDFTNVFERSLTPPRIDNELLGNEFTYYFDERMIPEVYDYAIRFDTFRADSWIDDYFMFSHDSVGNMFFVRIAFDAVLFVDKKIIKIEENLKDYNVVFYEDKLIFWRIAYTQLGELKFYCFPSISKEYIKNLKQVGFEHLGPQLFANLGPLYNTNYLSLIPNKYAIVGEYDPTGFHSNYVSSVELPSSTMYLEKFPGIRIYPFHDVVCSTRLRYKKLRHISR